MVERQVCIALDSHLVATSLKIGRNQAVEHSNLAQSLERMMDHALQMAVLARTNPEIELDNNESPIVEIDSWQKAIKQLMINIRTRDSHEIEEARLSLKLAQNQITKYEEDLLEGGKLSEEQILFFRISESNHHKRLPAKGFEGNQSQINRQAKATGCIELQNACDNKYLTPVISQLN